MWVESWCLNVPTVPIFTCSDGHIREPLLLLSLQSGPTPALSEERDKARRNQGVKVPCREPGDHDHSWTINTAGPSLSNILLYLKLESIKPLLKRCSHILSPASQVYFISCNYRQGPALLTRNGTVTATITTYRNSSPLCCAQWENEIRSW